MNDHTKKLLDLALNQAVPETWTTLSHEQITKLSQVFAELIVRECLTIMIDAHYSKCNLDDAIWNTRIHFGVEE